MQAQGNKDAGAPDLRTPIYMDYHATTPLDPRVLNAMMPYLRGDFGNAASVDHEFGWKAEEAVEKARHQVAGAIGAVAKEIVFTSGATESDNLAIKGVFEALPGKNHIITVVTEHKAVLDTCRYLENHLGARVTYLSVDQDGLITPAQVKAAIAEDTALVTVMAANNEIGVLQPVAEIGAICRKSGVLFHTDAAQALGKVPFSVPGANVDLVSLSAHKTYGPKGVGALWVRSRPRIRLAARMHGGGHEQGMRSGTLNVPGIVGFGAACEIAVAEMTAEATRLLELRQRLLQRITSQVDHVHVNGHPDLRLPGNLNLSVAFVEAESLVLSLQDVAVSTGSACTSTESEPSYVLSALGMREDLVHTGIRFGLGRFTTADQVDYVADRIAAVVPRLRELSPLWEMYKNGADLESIEWPKKTNNDEPRT